MTKRRPLVRTWLFPAWTLFIFLHSLQPADLSGRESGWVLSLLLRLAPWLTDHIIRKAAHFTEFAVLGFLSEYLGRGFFRLSGQDLSGQDLSRQDLSRQNLSGQNLSGQDLPGPQNRGRLVFRARTAAWLSLSLCAAAALTDETIQLFVEGRSGQVSDVWLDISGAAFGLALCVLVQTARRRKKGGTAG